MAWLGPGESLERRSPLVQEPALAPAPQAPPSHRYLYLGLGILLFLFGVTLATLLVAEAKTSHFQAQ
ncbi:MAG: hypothetical protein LPK20_03620, partial [Halomonas sp.]|nr:hypothetical protein [Halomonas sp.]